MKKFKFSREVAGYSRGYQTVEVEAETLQEAESLINTHAAVMSDVEIVRDDRDKGDWYPES